MQTRGLKNILIKGTLRGHSFNKYAKFSEKTNISYPLIRTRTYSYNFTKKDPILGSFWKSHDILQNIKSEEYLQGVINVSSSENFPYILNE